MEPLRTRDVVVFFKGATITVDVTDLDAREGWAGGTGFQWAQSETDRLVATRSTGLVAGFALCGSDEAADEFTAMTRNQPAYRFVVLGAGGWIISTANYEKYTYASRTGGGPLIPLTYRPSDRLVFSLRGLWTVEDEFSLSGDPRAPNRFFIGFVTQKPAPERGWYLGIQVSI